MHTNQEVIMNNKPKDFESKIRGTSSLLIRIRELEALLKEETERTKRLRREVDFLSGDVRI
jgi:hypothetical protein